MAITFISGNKLKGISSDPKPSNAQDKAILFSTDNGDLWDYSTSLSTWVQRSGSLNIGILSAFT